MLSGQDIHFSNTRALLNIYNPSSTGDFKGNIRASAVYRDQYSSFITKPYRTISISIDSPVAYGLSKKHWIGSGIQIYNDRAGDLTLVRNGLAMALSYHVSLDNAFNNVVSLGLSYGSIKSNLDPTSANFSGQSEDLNYYTQSQSNLVAGLKYKTLLGKATYFETGLAIQRLGSDTTLRRNNDLSGRFNFHMLFDHIISKKLSISPELYYSSSQNFSNLSFHLFPEIKLRKNSDIILRPGLGMRFGDALIFHLGGTYKKWKINFSYDITTSSASDYTNRYGGFELGVQRLFLIKTKPKVKLKQICPRL